MWGTGAGVVPRLLPWAAVAAAIVDRGGRARLHRAGVGGIPTERPFRRRDHMRLASVAKAFSGAVALSLVDRGALSLNDSIGEVLPSLPAAWSGVTLRQALDHTAGLPDYIEDPAFIDALMADPRQYFSPQGSSPTSPTTRSCSHPARAIATPTPTTWSSAWSSA